MPHKKDHRVIDSKCTRNYLQSVHFSEQGAQDTIVHASSLITFRPLCSQAVNLIKEHD